MEQNNSKWRIGVIVGLIAILGLVVFGSATMKQTTSDKIWTEAMTVGNKDAKNYYVMYTDLVCPYCDVFSRAVMEHWDEFESYLSEHDILFELRLTDALYVGVGSQMSRDSAEAAYCAARENKFWDYYHRAIKALWDDYQSKGIGSSKTAPAIKNLPEDYWTTIGERAGLGDEFKTCVAEHATASDVDTYTARALQVSSGMPTFVFNNFTNAGFGENWGWEQVLMYLDAGLKK